MRIHVLSGGRQHLGGGVLQFLTVSRPVFSGAGVQPDDVHPGPAGGLLLPAGLRVQPA